ncbi:LOW QUALITY PROTEIN: xenotropic and polytropic retrovirus receptor 1 homolog [Amphiura filiformis]|uniref:LOW QUALITY PROTEIN: xenotropic and polytropic retrovirus receptor 1 homolog n=1 Tax=Amphiura filiformis TaxID=82378 RepID=UPI003B21575A
MRFTEHLGAHITPEWRKQYIKYEELKDMLYQAKEDAPSPEFASEPDIERFYAKFEEKFFQLCDKELSKVNTFFSEKVAEAMRNFAQLQDEIRQVDSRRCTRWRAPARRRSTVFAKPRLELDKNKSQRQKLADVKLAFSEFYLSLILLQNYQNLNFTGFRKILKKHDKMMETERGTQFRQSRVEAAPFFTNKQIDNVILEVETLYINELEAGNRTRAMNKLRVPPLGAKGTNWTTFRVGLYSGIFIVLMFIVVYAGIGAKDAGIEWRPAVRMYRGMFLVILMIFLLGINTYGWRKSGVNHVLIFELDPRHNLSHEQLLEIALFLAVLWSMSILAFIYCHFVGIPSYANPLILAGFMFLFFINPTRTLYYRARFWLLRILFRILIAPFHPVGFADFWLADQLNSLQTVLLDVEFFLCYYSCEVSWLGDHNCAIQCHTFSYYARVFVACLPAWFRFAQCLRRYHDTKLVFPHLVNAGKYSTTFFVVCFSALAASNKSGVWSRDPLFYMWVLSAFISSCYTLTWDLKMDWGLLSKNTQNNRVLREDIVYPETSYYFAIIEDFFLRFTWTLTVSIGQLGYLEGDILVSILAPLEVFRRFVWNFFRLENEHLNNCGQFRAVRDISIKPDKEVLNPKSMEQMMDDESTIPLMKSKTDTDLFDLSACHMVPRLRVTSNGSAGSCDRSIDDERSLDSRERSLDSRERSLEEVNGDNHNNCNLQHRKVKVTFKGKKTKTEVVESVGKDVEKEAYV